MKKTMIWIESGDISMWLGKAIAGAFENFLILDFDKICAEGVIDLIPQIKEQPGVLIGIFKTPIAMMRKFDGIVVLPYTTRTKITMKNVIVHKPSGKKDERDRIVTEVLEFLKKEKVLKRG